VSGASGGGLCDTHAQVGVTTVPSEEQAMRMIVAIVALALASPAAADKVSCGGWKRLGSEQKVDHIYGVIETHLNSNRSKSFTSEHNSRMRRCLQDFTPRIVLDYDDACSEGRITREGLDDIFDGYLLSCVQ